MRPNIAIDGPAGAGKSTIAKMVAKRLGFLYIDTGAMYRAVAYCALEKGINVQSREQVVELASGLQIALQNGEDGRLRVYCNGIDVTERIREQAVSRNVSKVASVPEVRVKMVEQQRKIASCGGVVMDGRDIGTYVLPDAQLKFFITASLEERTTRRMKELAEKGVFITFSALKKEIALRDKIDSEREMAPLSAAEDAVIIDTTDMTVEQVVEKIIKIYEQRMHADV